MMIGASGRTGKLLLGNKMWLQLTVQTFISAVLLEIEL